jgi:CheY-like chemotaxis protein
MDRQMPVLDGVGATRKIRALEAECFTASAVSLSARSSQALEPAYLVGMSASIESFFFFFNKIQRFITRN